MPMNNSKLKNAVYWISLFLCLSVFAFFFGLYAGTYIPVRYTPPASASALPDDVLLAVLDSYNIPYRAFHTPFKKSMALYISPKDLHLVGRLSGDYDADAALAAQAMEAFLKSAEDETVVSGIYVLRTEKHEYQQRSIFYTTSSVLKPNPDGSRDEIKRIAALFELYAVTDPSTGECLTFCGRVVAPKHFDPADWEDYGITEKNYDPELHLKEDIREKASKRAARNALAFLDSNRQFTQEMWITLFGKPFAEDVTRQEVSEKFRYLKEFTANLQEKQLSVMTIEKGDPL